MADETVTEVTTTPETATPGGAEPPVETTDTTPATEKQGSEASIPKSRFDEVIAQRNQERAEKARLMAILEQRQQQPSQPTPADPDPEPDEAKYDDYPKYIRELAKWQGRQAAREAYAEERKRDEQQQAARTEGEKINQAWQNYKTKTAGESEDFHESARSMPLGEHLWIAVAKSENPAAVIKHLQANPAELARLNTLPVMDRLIEYGRLETKLAGSNGQPQVSQMPKPMKPVGSGKSGDKHPNDYTQDDVTRRLYPR